MKRAALAVALVVFACAPAAEARHVEVIGRSSAGRPIEAIEVGNAAAPVRILVVGCIHGNEQAGIPIAWRLAGMAPRNADLWIVPVLNPDGVTANTRQNGRGVDLNRNFPWDWQDLEGVFDSGPRALSEPETRAAVRLIRRIRPTISIWYHQHLTLVDLSGGNYAIERRYARLVGLRAVRLGRFAGSVTGWENHLMPQSTAFVVELPAGSLSPAAVARHAGAVLALAH